MILLRLLSKDTLRFFFGDLPVLPLLHPLHPLLDLAANLTELRLKRILFSLHHLLNDLHWHLLNLGEQVSAVNPHLLMHDASNLLADDEHDVDIRRGLTVIEQQIQLQNLLDDHKVLLLSNLVPRVLNQADHV